MWPWRRTCAIRLHAVRDFHASLTTVLPSKRRALPLLGTLRGLLGASQAPLERPHKTHQCVESKHREAQRQFQSGADHKPQGCSQPRSARFVEAALVAQFARHGSSKGPEGDSKQPEEESQKRPNGRTEGGPGAGSEAFCPESRRREVDRVREQRKQAEYSQADCSYVLEVIGPGGQDEAGEDQGRSRQKRKDQPSQPNDDEGPGDQVEEGRCDFQNLPRGLDPWGGSEA